MASTIELGGLVSGLDTGAIIDALVDVERNYCASPREYSPSVSLLPLFVRSDKDRAQSWTVSSPQSVSTWPVLTEICLTKNAYHIPRLENAHFASMRLKKTDS